MPGMVAASALRKTSEFRSMWRLNTVAVIPSSDSVASKDTIVEVILVGELLGREDGKDVGCDVG
jgi:hypothetical protein